MMQDTQHALCVFLCKAMQLGQSSTIIRRIKLPPFSVRNFNPSKIPVEGEELQDFLFDLENGDSKSLDIWFDSTELHCVRRKP
jgi:hypothetical protein